MFNTLFRDALLAAAISFAALCLASAVPAVAEEAQAALSTQKPAQVAIDNFAFTPQVLQVKAGATVTFVNHDDIPHSVVSDAGTFRSHALDTDQAYTFTFAKAGEYAYFCGLHPHMKGKIVVTP